MNQDQPENAEDYGENCFEFYDQIVSSVDRNMIDTLQRLAAGGRVLELGVGTGRIALPLAARGVDIYGIEASPSMLAVLAEKSCDVRSKVSQGNFADVAIDGSFALVFAVVSTFFLLSSHAEQQRCFQAVAGKLTDQGLFLMENYKPLGLRPLEPDGDQKCQIYLTEQVITTAKGLRKYRARICYAAPQELDEMAASVGLRLRERWSNWRGKPFAQGDLLNISIYEHAKPD